MDESEPWRLIIIRSQGVHLLRPERGWRPIVTVDVDHHPQHEVQLGNDGQNPNLKIPFLIRDVDTKTVLQIRVWHRSQSKKKGKKRNLVATADVSLGETLRRFGHDANHDTELDVRLNSTARQNESRRVRGVRPDALLRLRLQAPASVSTSSSCATLVDEDHYQTDVLSEHGYTTEAYTTREPSPVKPEVVTAPPLPPLPESVLRRRRGKVRGYHPDTDSDSCLSDGCSSQGEPPRYSDLDEDECAAGAVPMPSWSADGWFAAAMIPRIRAATILPRFSSDNISIESHKLRFEDALDSFTPYGDLQKAEVDADFERVLDNLRREWLGVGASLIALAGLDAAVFGFSDQTLFQIDGFAKNMVALSSIASGVGLFTSAWFLALYSFQDARRFQRRALDLYGTYFFFCLSCRLPTLCMTISACSLMLFLSRVAWMTWKTATLVMSFVAGVIVSLQYLVYGLHSIFRLVFRVAGAGRRLVLRVVARRTTNLAGAEEGGAAGVAPGPVPAKQEEAQSPVSPFSPRPCLIGTALAQLPQPTVLDGAVTDEPVQEEDIAGAGRILAS